MANDSLPELELANARAREGITDTVAEIRRRTDVPARTRLAVAKTRQRWHRDPTPLVALGLTAVAGVTSIVVGVVIRRSPAARLDALHAAPQTDPSKKSPPVAAATAKVAKRSNAIRKQAAKRSKHAAKG